MAAQSRWLHIQYGVKIGTEVIPADDWTTARRMMQTLRASSPKLVSRRVKHVEHFWEEVV